MAKKYTNYGRAIPGMSWSYPQKYFPWDRPPQITNMEAAKIYSTNLMLDKDVQKMAVDHLKNGTPVQHLSQYLSDIHVLDGTWTPDIAGPMTAYMGVQLLTIADELEIEPNFGKAKNNMSTINLALSKRVREQEENSFDEMVKEDDKLFDTEEESKEKPVRGLMSREGVTV
jgi:hypothetical protein